MVDKIIEYILNKNRLIGIILVVVAIAIFVDGAFNTFARIRQIIPDPLIIPTGLAIAISLGIAIGSDKQGNYSPRARKLARFMALISLQVLVLSVWDVIVPPQSYNMFFSWGIIGFVIVSIIFYYITECNIQNSKKLRILFFEFSDGASEEIPKDRYITHSVQKELSKKFQGTKVSIANIREVVIDETKAAARGRNAEAAAVIYGIYSKREKNIILDLGFEVTTRPEYYQPVDLKTKVLPIDELDTGHLEILIETDYANVTNFLVGLFEYSSGDFKAAINTFTFLANEANAIADFSSLKTEIIYLYLGNSYYMLGDIESSKRDFDKVLSINPDNAKAMHNIGIVEHNKGNSGKAIEAFSNAISLDNQLYVAYRNRAFALILQDNYGEALKDLLIYILANPSNPDALKLAALCHSELGEHSEAINKFKLAQKRSPHDLNIVFDLADEYITVKRYFLGLITPLLHLYQIGQWAVIFGYIGDTLAEFKYARLANLFFTIALIFDNKNSSLYFSRSDARLYFGKLNSAKLDLKKAIKLAPEIAIYYFNLGNLHMQERNFLEAQQVYAEGIKLSPSFPDFYVNRAYAFYNLQKYDEVVQDCRTYLDLTKSNEIEILKLLGLSLLQTTLFDEAIEHLIEVYNCELSERNKSNLVNAHFAYVKNLVDSGGELKKIIYHYKSAKNIEPTAKLDDYYEDKISRLMNDES